MVRGRCAKSTGPIVYKIKYWNTMWYKVEISHRCFVNAKKRVVNSVRWNNRGPKVRRIFELELGRWTGFYESEKGQSSSSAASIYTDVKERASLVYKRSSVMIKQRLYLKETAERENWKSRQDK